MDWKTILKSQQQDFYRRLRLGNLLFCEPEYFYSEVTIIKGEQLQKIIADAQKIITKYENNSDVDFYCPTFSELFSQKLGETAFLYRYSDLISKEENILDNNQEIKPPLFTLKSNHNVSIQIKTFYGNLRDLVWSFSSEEIAQHQIIVCIFNQQEFDIELKEYQVILAGFIPSKEIENFDQKKDFFIHNLFYTGGLRSCLTNANHSESNYFQNAKICEKKGNYSGAVANYSKLILVNDQDAKLYLLRGINNYKIGDIQGALLDLSTAIIRDEKNHIAYHWRGFIYTTIGKYKEAIKDYDEEIKINSVSFFAYYKRAYVNSILGNNLSALNDYTTAITINSNLFQAFYNKGNINYLLKDIQGAIEDYKQALKLNPSLSKAYYNLGIINHQLGNYNEAINYYQEAVKIDPFYCKSYYNLAILFSDVGEYQKAIDIYDKIGNININFFQANYNKRALISLLKNENHIFIKEENNSNSSQMSPYKITIDEYENNNYNQAKNLF